VKGEKMIFSFKKGVFLATMLILSFTLFVGCPKESRETVELPPDATGTAVRGDAIVEQPTTRSWDARGPVESRPSTGEIPKVSEGAFETIYFDFDKYNLRPDAIEAIQRNMQAMKQNDSIKILIEGHCDERGTNEYNMALGMRRANTCKSYFIANGIDSSRISIISYGEERPVDPNHSESAWTKNRRAEFLVVSK
jgi:peptidoglycan-associated lipoprotein